MGISYKEGLRKWVSNDYTFSDAKYNYVIKGALYSEPARANDSYGPTNVVLFLNSVQQIRYLLVAPVADCLNSSRFHELARIRPFTTYVLVR